MKRMIASAFRGTLVVSVPEELTEGARFGSAQGKAVLYLPKRGWYIFWVTQSGPEIYQHYRGPFPEPPEGFKEGLKPWEPYRVAQLFGVSGKCIKIE